MFNVSFLFSLSNNDSWWQRVAKIFVNVSSHQQKAACFAGCFELTGWQEHSFGAWILSALLDMIGWCVVISDETFKCSSSVPTSDTERGKQLFFLPFAG